MEQVFPSELATSIPTPPARTLRPGLRTPWHSAGFPTDVQADSARRLRIAAVLYAFVFFVSDPLTAMFLPDGGAFFSTILQWGPATISILAALIVVVITGMRRIPTSTVLSIGLSFQVVGSFGIAAAQFLDVDLTNRELPMGLSWVAVWMLAFTVTVPNAPRRALAAALASGSAVPIVLAYVVTARDLDISPIHYFMHAVLPYLLVVLVAYVSARVVHSLGTQLKHARELGSYRLIERIGHGGMGEVWRAQHRLLARAAAIKLIRLADDHAGVAASELRMRFEREAQATASLRSPHTIELYDFGVTDDQVFYYVMELLDGCDLQALVERFGPLPVDRAVHLLEQICHSLGEAHDRGLIHRDIKPANIYVCRYGRDADFVKVLDFGLVKPHHEEGRTMPDLTCAFGTRGTPGFMAPEQIVGGHEVDGRADIYALGCVAFWLVTGRAVFSGRTPMDTILKHVQEPPVPPSSVPGVTIPTALDDLILACLAKNPDDRPATADIVAARLGEVELDTQWSQARAWAWWDAARQGTTSSGPPLLDQNLT